MDIKHQKQMVECCLNNKEKIEKKERWIKILNSNLITRFLFYHNINILELEIMKLHFDSIGNALSGISDIKFNKKLKKEVKNEN